MDDRMLRNKGHPSLEQFMDAWNESTPAEQGVVEAIWNHLVEGDDMRWDGENTTAEALQHFILELENEFCTENVLRVILDVHFKVKAVVKKRRKKRKAAQEEITAARQSRGLTQTKSRTRDKPVAQPKLQGVNYRQPAQKKEGRTKSGRRSFVVKKDMDLAPDQNRMTVTEKRDFFFTMMRLFTACHEEDIWIDGQPTRWADNLKVSLMKERFPHVCAPRVALSELAGDSYGAVGRDVSSGRV